MGSGGLASGSRAPMVGKAESQSPENSSQRGQSALLASVRRRKQEASGGTGSFQSIQISFLLLLLMPLGHTSVAVQLTFWFASFEGGTYLIPWVLVVRFIWILGELALRPLEPSLLWPLGCLRDTAFFGREVEGSS